MNPAVRSDAFRKTFLTPRNQASGFTKCLQERTDAAGDRYERVRKYDV